MNLPEAPKLPVLPFLVGDGILIAAAAFIAHACAAPIQPGPLLAITLCVIAAAILGAIPFIANYGKNQDAELTERQHQIAALARTTAESAEQLSIAAASLHGIAEASSRNLQLIEQLPAQLKDHAAVLQRQLSETAKAALASSKTEADRLDAAATRIAATLADLTRLETTAHEHRAAIDRALTRFPADVEKVSAQTARRLAEAATAAMTEAKAHALADLDLRLAATVTPALAPIETTTAADSPPRKRAKPAPEAPAAPSSTEPDAPVAPIASAAAPTAESIPASAEPSSIPQAPEPESAFKPAPAPEPEASPAAPVTLDSHTAERAALESSPAIPPPPAPAETPSLPELHEISAIVATTTVDPAAIVAESPAAFINEAPLSAPADPSPEEVPVDAASKPRARTPKPVAPAAEPVPDLGLSVENPEHERALSSDGFTRLTATAYIGIGNKLFIRGDGPGLSWDKGVPLQFISIGKWRWETADATALIRAKLYKNDQIECASVGQLTLEPGHQHDVNAGF